MAVRYVCYNHARVRHKLRLCYCSSQTTAINIMPKVLCQHNILKTSGTCKVLGLQMRATICFGFLLTSLQIYHLHKNYVFFFFNFPFVLMGWGEVLLLNLLFWMRLEKILYEEKELFWKFLLGAVWTSFDEYKNHCLVWKMWISCLFC